jgi:hypothetical protein
VRERGDFGPLLFLSLGSSSSSSSDSCCFTPLLHLLLRRRPTDRSVLTDRVSPYDRQTDSYLTDRQSQSDRQTESFSVAIVIFFFAVLVLVLGLRWGTYASIALCACVARWGTYAHIALCACVARSVRWCAMGCAKIHTGSALFLPHLGCIPLGVGRQLGHPANPAPRGHSIRQRYHGKS